MFELNDKFFFCPVCGSLEGQPYKLPYCFECESETTYLESKNNFDYYRKKSMEIYGDYLHWYDVFEKEELFLNSQYEPSIKVRKLFDIYCPICGKVDQGINEPVLTVCSNCNQSVVYKKSKHERKFYQYKSMALYGDYIHWQEILYEEDLSQNPEFNSDIYNGSVLVYNPKKPKPTANTPKCPTCGSTKIKKISSASKVAGAALFGLFSKTARSQFQCENCGYKW